MICITFLSRQSCYLSHKNEMKKTIVTLLLSWSMIAWAQAQETHVSTHDTHKSFPHFRVAGLIGHTFLPTLPDSDERTIIPSWGLDIEYWFNEAWGLGLHNDVEIQSFLIETEQGEFLEREFPLVLTLDALYKMKNGLVLQLGPGYEIEKNESFFLVRAGLEYEIEMNHHWDISPTFFYDSRFEANDTWTIALGFGKRF